MGRTRDAAWKWLQFAFAANGRSQRPRRKRRNRDRHQNQPGYWQGLASLEPRLMLSMTANIVDPPLPYVIDEAGSITFSGEAGGAPVTPTWDISAAHNPTSTTERMVRVDGNRVVWSSGTSSTGNESVWFRDGSNAPVDLSGHLNVGATEPVIWENYVAFSTSGAIYLYDINDSTTTDLQTDTTIPKVQVVATGSHLTNLEINDGRIVFQGGSGGAYIQMYIIASGNLVTISEPTDPVEEHPDISGGQVAWRGFNGVSGTHDVFLYDIATAQTTNLSSLVSGGDGEASAPQIADGRVVWGSNVGNVYYFDGTAAQEIGDTTLTNIQPVISADRAAWWTTSGAIWSLDVSQPISATNQAVQLVTGLSVIQDPQVDGKNIVWSSNEGGSREVFLYDGDAAVPVAPIRISTQAGSASATDAFPVISGRNVAWVGGGDVSFAQGLGLTIAWDFGDGNTAVDTLAPSHTYADDGVYTVTLTVSDGTIAATDSLTLTVNNLAPTVQISGGPAGEVNEGDGISFTFSGSDPAGAADPLTYSWSVLKNGNAFASGAGTNVSFAPDDNGSYELRATADDGDGGVTTAVQTVNVINAAPVIGSFSVPALAVRSQDVTVSAAFADAGSADTHIALWEVYGPANVLVASGSGTTLQFTPTDLGSHTVTFTVTDDDGGIDTGSAVLNVVVAAFGADPLNSGHMLLTIGGGAANDFVRVRERDGLFEVLIDHQLHGGFTLAADDRIQVFGGAGNDWIRLDTPAGIHAEVHGGDGNDWIRTGDGDDIIVGGAGDDLIFGNGGRDLLIGGAGSDVVLGNDEDDILIGGEYLQSNDRAALLAISAAWTSSLSYLDRIGIITAGVGPGGSYRLDASTLLDDGVSDLLLGLRGLDWFIGHGDQDITDDRSYEVLTAAEHNFVTEI